MQSLLGSKLQSGPQSDSLLSGSSHRIVVKRRSRGLNVRGRSVKRNNERQRSRKRSAQRPVASELRTLGLHLRLSSKQLHLLHPRLGNLRHLQLASAVMLQGTLLPKRKRPDRKPTRRPGRRPFARNRKLKRPIVANSKKNRGEKRKNLPDKRKRRKLA